MRTPERTYKIKGYNDRVSCILRQATWWVIEKSTDLRHGGKQDFLEEEVKMFVSLYLPENPPIGLRWRTLTLLLK